MPLSEDDIYVLLHSLKRWKQELEKIVFNPLFLFVPGRGEAVQILQYLTKLQYQLVVVLQQMKYME